MSQQPTPTQFNLSYRGLGNPQESEYVLVMQDGIPLEADWIGFPTLYAMPFSHSIADIQLIRGGASLLYGPEPAPVIRSIRDELVQLVPGVYLGKILFNTGSDKYSKIGYFALRTPR